MAMLLELDKVFPYSPLFNYPWLHFTGNVICTMRRERSVYMEGIGSVPKEEEDVDMRGVHDEEVCAKSVRADVDIEGVLEDGVVPVDSPVAEPKMGGGTMAKTVLPLDVVAPGVLGSGLACPHNVRTYLKWLSGTLVLGAAEVTTKVLPPGLPKVTL